MERHLVGAWQRLERGKEEMLRRVGARGAEAREWRSGEGRWSLADVVEHIVLAEGGLGTALTIEPKPDKPRVVAPGRTFRWLGLRTLLRTGVRIKAPVDAILPRRELPWHALLARWEEQRRGLEIWLRAADPAILPTPRFKHPIVGWLDVPHALEFAADHLDHHLLQVRRIERTLRRGPG